MPRKKPPRAFRHVYRSADFVSELLNPQRAQVHRDMPRRIHAVLHFLFVGVSVDKLVWNASFVELLLRRAPAVEFSYS